MSPAAIKVALMLEKQTLCPTINFESPNPNIDFENLKLEVVTELEVLTSDPVTGQQLTALDLQELLLMQCSNNLLDRQRKQTL